MGDVIRLGQTKNDQRLENKALDMVILQSIADETGAYYAVYSPTSRKTYVVQTDKQCNPVVWREWRCSCDWAIPHAYVVGTEVRIKPARGGCSHVRRVRQHIEGARAIQDERGYGNAS